MSDETKNVSEFVKTAVSIALNFPSVKYSSGTPCGCGREIAELIELAALKLNDQSEEKVSEAKGPYTGGDYVGKRPDCYALASSRDVMIANISFAAGRESRDGLRKSLEFVSTWWFDPQDEKSACGECDANLHPNAMGKHIQLNGDPCPFQVAKEALEADGEETK